MDRRMGNNAPPRAAIKREAHIKPNPASNNIFSLLAVDELPEESQIKKVAAPAKAAAPKAAPKAIAPEPKPAPKPKAAEGEKPAAPREHVRREDMPVREGKRIYERHSAPGRGRPAPKEGHNSWGTAKDEMRETPVEEVKEEAAPVAEDAAAAETKPAEPTELDLATYLKKREAAAVHIALPEARKAGEGVEMDPEWENVQELQRDEEVLFVPKKDKSGKKKAEKKEAASAVPLGQFLADSRAGQQLATRMERERRDRQRRERFARDDAAAAPAPEGSPKAAPKPLSPRERRAPAARPAPVAAPLKVDDKSFPSLAGGKKTPPQAAPAAAPAAQ